MTAQRPANLQLVGLSGMPLVRPGDDLAGLILDALEQNGEALRDGDVLVIAQKVVSKAEGRIVELSSVEPSARALSLAAATGKDARLVELMLAESEEVVRFRLGVIVVAHRLGFVMANAGIDQSNVASNGDSLALLLPRDPDGSCASLRAEFRARAGVDVGVVINDTHGRAWRNGTAGVAIGVAGLPALVDLRGHPDLFGRALRITEVGMADELASAASLLMGQSDEGRPVVLARGIAFPRRDGNARELIRPRELDLFR
jgi:coenzyme F420-0:L-glutamate ligase / coenzyme F420-1:gamma-L-glutamate ligase